MKVTMVYLVMKEAVNIYEKVIAKATYNYEQMYEVVKTMNEIAQELVKEEDVRFNELGVKIAIANVEALAKMC